MRLLQRLTGSAKRLDPKPMVRLEFRAARPRRAGDPPQIGTLYRVIAVLLFVIAAVLLFGHDATEASLISGMERPGGHCCN